VINEGEQESLAFQRELQRLKEEAASLDEEVLTVEALTVVRQKEWTKKIELEANLVERCREFMQNQQSAIEEERKKIAVAT